MPVTVRIPTPLRPLTGGRESVAAQGATLKEVVNHLEESYKGVRERICDEKGNLRRFVNLFVNEEDARVLQGLDTPVKDGDEISIIPAIAGGRGGLRIADCGLRIFGVGGRTRSVFRLRRLPSSSGE